MRIHLLIPVLLIALVTSIGTLAPGSPATNLTRSSAYLHAPSAQDADPNAPESECWFPAQAENGRTIVRLRSPDMDVQATAQDMAAQYGLVVRSVLQCALAFTADVPLETRSSVRWDKRVATACANADFPEPPVADRSAWCRYDRTQSLAGRFATMLPLPSPTPVPTPRPSPGGRYVPGASTPIASNPNPGGVRVPVVTIANWDGGFGGGTVYVIRSANAWYDVWSLLYYQDSAMPEMAPIDFNKSMALIIVRGFSPSSGYSLRVSQVIETTAELNVYVDDIIAIGRECIPLTMVTSPFTVVTIPQSDRPIQLHVNQRRDPACDDPPTPTLVPRRR